MKLSSDSFIKESGTRGPSLWLNIMLDLIFQLICVSFVFQQPQIVILIHLADFYRKQSNNIMKSGSILKQCIEIIRNSFSIAFGGKAIHKNEFMLFNFCFVFFFFGKTMLRCTFDIVVFSFILSFSQFVTFRMTRMIARGVNYKLFSLVFNFVERERFSFLGALSTSSPLLHLVRVTWDRPIIISNWVGEGECDWNV